MQELITHLEMHKSRVDMVDINSLIDYTNSSLEKEKEQIIKAGDVCAQKHHFHQERINKMDDGDLIWVNKNFAYLSFGEEYYNETYNQNK